MTPVPWRLWEGQVVDHLFPLRRYLGGTDQSAVFLTQYGDPEPRHAVIKLVLAPAQDQELLAQWDRAAQLSHPHLLRLLRRGSWQIDQHMLHYVVTEYAEENLVDVLAERPLTASEAREMLAPLLDALAYIHGEGLVHGHLKPSNIMAVGDQLKLSVDGISRVGDLAVSLPAPGAYDPPEFSDRGCSPIGDIWSFGMTLVETLTRRLPVWGGPKEDPVLPETLPPEFLPLVRACLRPDPKRRAPLPDVLALLQPLQPQPASPVLPDPPPPRRKWVSLVLVSAAALALAAILAVPRLVNRRLTSVGGDPAVAQNAATQTVAKPEIHPAVAPDVSNTPPVPPAEPVAEPPATLPPATPAPLRRLEAKPGLVLRQVMPEIPTKAQQSIHGKVRINVVASVDAAGHVANTKIESHNSRYFANLAAKAAEQWEFVPGDSAGEWVLRFEFTQKGMEVQPARTAR